ncbi:MAG: 5'/3'-nucleotidase SurE [Bacillaceae bacterium]|nr:5'/3'-nucleotidase SurE [Bacillaceae bacterium]
MIETGVNKTLRRILITNDDGIDALGIHKLVLAARELGEVYVVAPDCEQSSVGHAITVREGLRANRVPFHEMDGVKAWKVNGTPADCVKMALHVILKEKPDIVISGINAGVNLGKDVYYSGTVSGAREAVIHGLPAIAVSYDNHFHRDDFGDAVEILSPVLKNVIEHPIPRETLLNINIPHRPLDDIKGVVPAPLSLYHYRDLFETRPAITGEEEYWIERSYENNPVEEGDDYHMLRNGYVTITPVHIDSTDWRYMEKMTTWSLDRSLRGSS